MAQLVRALAGLGGWCHAWGPRLNPRTSRYSKLVSPPRCKCHCLLDLVITEKQYLRINFVITFFCY